MWLSEDKEITRYGGGDHQSFSGREGVAAEFLASLLVAQARNNHEMTSLPVIMTEKGGMAPGLAPLFDLHWKEKDKSHLAQTQKENQRLAEACQEVPHTSCACVAQAREADLKALDLREKVEGSCHDLHKVDKGLCGPCHQTYDDTINRLSRMGNFIRWECVEAGHHKGWFHGPAAKISGFGAEIEATTEETILQAAVHLWKNQHGSGTSVKWVELVERKIIYPRQGTYSRADRDQEKFHIDANLRHARPEEGSHQSYLDIEWRQTSEGTTFMEETPWEPWPEMKVNPWVKIPTIQERAKYKMKPGPRLAGKKVIIYTDPNLGPPGRLIEKWEPPEIRWPKPRIFIRGIATPRGPLKITKGNIGWDWVSADGEFSLSKVFGSDAPVKEKVIRLLTRRFGYGNFDWGWETLEPLGPPVFHRPLAIGEATKIPLMRDMKLKVPFYECRQCGKTPHLRNDFRWGRYLYYEDGTRVQCSRHKGQDVWPRFYGNDKELRCICCGMSTSPVVLPMRVRFKFKNVSEGATWTVDFDLEGRMAEELWAFWQSNHIMGCQGTCSCILSEMNRKSGRRLTEDEILRREAI